MAKREKEKSSVGLDISNSELEALIDNWVRGERNRKILKRRLIDEIIFEDLSFEFDLSVRQTKRIVYREQERIFKKLK